MIHLQNFSQHKADTPNARYIFTGSEGAGAKVRVREEKNPDHRLRPPNDR